MNRSTRAITQGAMTAALCSLVVLLDRLLGGFIAPFLPLPIIIYGQYHKISDTVLVTIVSVILVAIVPGDLPTTILMLLYGLLALLHVSIEKIEINKKLRFLIMLAGVGVLYFVMITTFGEFFGLDYEVNFMALKNFLKTNNESLVKTLIFGLIFITMVMETYIVSTSANFIKWRISAHRNKD